MCVMNLFLKICLNAPPKGLNEQRTLILKCLCVQDIIPRHNNGEKYMLSIKAVVQKLIEVKWLIKVHLKLIWDFSSIRLLLPMDWAEGTWLPPPPGPRCQWAQRGNPYLFSLIPSVKRTVSHSSSSTTMDYFRSTEGLLQSLPLGSGSGHHPGPRLCRAEVLVLDYPPTGSTSLLAAAPPTPATPLPAASIP